MPAACKAHRIPAIAFNSIEFIRGLLILHFARCGDPDGAPARHRERSVVILHKRTISPMGAILVTARRVALEIGSLGVSARSFGTTQPRLLRLDCPTFKDNSGQNERSAGPSTSRNWMSECDHRNAGITCSANSSKCGCAQLAGNPGGKVHE